MLEQWTITIDNTDSTLTPDVDALAALDSLLAYGPEYLDRCSQRTQYFAKLVTVAKVQANNARN